LGRATPLRRLDRRHRWPLLPSPVRPLLSSSRPALSLLPLPPLCGLDAGMRRRRCLRGEREHIFSSPLSSEAKFVGCMHVMLEVNLTRHIVEEEVQDCLQQCVESASSKRQYPQRREMERTLQKRASSSSMRFPCCSRRRQLAPAVGWIPWKRRGPKEEGGRPDLVQEEVAQGRRGSDPVEEEAARGREGSESGVRRSSSNSPLLPPSWRCSFPSHRIRAGVLQRMRPRQPRLRRPQVQSPPPSPATSTAANSTSTTSSSATRRRGSRSPEPGRPQISRRLRRCDLVPSAVVRLLPRGSAPAARASRSGWRRREREGDGWRRDFAAKREIPRGCVTGEGNLQNADADTASTGAAIVPLFLSFCRCSMGRATYWRQSKWLCLLLLDSV
jgi:hypothetical protein